MSRKMDVNVRQATKKDAPIISDIGQESFGISWGKNNFMNFLTEDNESRSIWVADYEGKPVGFRLQEKKRGFLHITELAVRPTFRRQGVGASLIENAFTQLSYSGLPKIIMEIRESDEVAREFLVKKEFKAKLLRGYYPDEDGFEMTYRLAGFSEKDDWTKDIENDIFEYWGGN